MIKFNRFEFLLPLNWILLWWWQFSLWHSRKRSFTSNRLLTITAFNFFPQNFARHLLLLSKSRVEFNSNLSYVFNDFGYSGFGFPPRVRLSYWHVYCDKLSSTLFLDPTTMCQPLNSARDERWSQTNHRLNLITKRIRFAGDDKEYFETIKIFRYYSCSALSDFRSNNKLS